MRRRYRLRHDLLFPASWGDRACMAGCFACLALAGVEALRPDLVLRLFGM